MRTGLKIGIVILVFTSVLIAMCTSKGNKKASKQHVYYFYPLPNMYYDSSDAVYIFQDSLSAWIESEQLPLKGDIGKNVRINQPSQPVWKENEKHRLLYSVVLYSDSNDFKKQAEPDSTSIVKTEKVVKKDDDTNQPENKKKKSGIKRFFERLFKSDKKKE